MTVEQKQHTEVIAIYDGWVKREYQPVHGRELWENDTHSEWLDSMPYLTSLNALHPVAMKVLKSLSQMSNLRDNIENSCSTEPINGEYIALFEAVYHAIQFLNQQKQTNETTPS